MKAKYLRQADFFFSVTSNATQSFVWRSMLKARDVLMQGLGKGINNGRGTKFWLDNWLPCGPLIDHAKAVISEDEAEMSVADYWENGSWNWARFQHKLDQDIVELIAGMWIDANSEEEDMFCWNALPDGLFSTKSAYKLQLSEEVIQHSHWPVLWS